MHLSKIKEAPKFVQTLNSNSLHCHFEIKTEMNAKICFDAKPLYAEQDFHFKNANSQTTKDFRFAASYFEKVD